MVKEQAVSKCNDNLKEAEKDKLRNSDKKVIINDIKVKCKPFYSLHKSIYNTKNPQRINRQRIKHYKSPTDQLLSPCSRKLDSYRSKCIVAKSTPMKLSFSSGTE